MPNAYNRAKMTGDTHLPDVESDMPLQESMNETAGAEETSGRGQAAERGGQTRPGGSSRQGGGLKDRDAKTSNSYGHTRESGEQPKK